MSMEVMQNHFSKFSSTFIQNTSIFPPIIATSNTGDETSDDNIYLSEECIAEEKVPIRIGWSLNKHGQSNKRSSNDIGTLEYHSMNKKPFIKLKDIISSDSSVDTIDCDDEILLKKEEPLESDSELPSESKYEDVSDESIEKFDPTDFIFGKAPSTETENDVKPNIISSEIWLMDEPTESPSELQTKIKHDAGSDESVKEKFDTTKFILEKASGTKTKNDNKAIVTSSKDWVHLPADKYTRQYGNSTSRSKLEKNLTDEDDSDPQTSFTDYQLSAQQSSQSTNDNEEEADPRDDCDNRYNLLLNSAKVRLIRFENRRQSTSGDRSGGEELIERKNNSQVKKIRKIREPLEAVNKKYSHNNRRITRGLIKSIENICPNYNEENDIGKFVWGYCMGWWPALIVAAEDGGLEPRADKVCVYWIGEDLISLLNEKTQIEPFSSNLDTRLVRYLKEDEQTKDRKKAIFVTLKLFSKNLHIPLLKPYDKWAAKHLLGKPHLNNLKFHPFPKNMQQRLDQLKKQNLKATAKIVQDEARAARSLKEPFSSNDQEIDNRLDRKLQDNGPQGKFPKDFVRKSTKELLLNREGEQHSLPLKDQKPGVIVWGKLAGHSWWPAMIIHCHDCGKKEPNFGNQWILWYGDYQLSEVNYQNVMNFNEGIKKMEGFITQCRREKYTNAVLSACKDHCARFRYDTTNWTMKDVLAWVSTLNNTSKTSVISGPDDGSLESRYSTHIAEKLVEMKSNQEIAAERESRIKNSDGLKAVFDGVPHILEHLCIVCLTIKHDIFDHPFFEFSICSVCVEELKATVFAYGDDGKCFYCTLCTGTDTIVMCDNCDCPRVYCTACLKYIICPSEYDDILIKDPWLCFLCDEAKYPHENRIFKPRLDWKIRIGQLFHTNKDTGWNGSWNNNGRKKKMRVLSLFDGISTGLLVLEQLGIAVEEYYASEIDADAETVSATYFGKKICRIGDVRNITKDIIDGIAPIDLLIGGSPCNDLSIVNPNRLGLCDPKGTGVLFFDYCRIKKLVIEANKDNHLFWLFENVASMSSKDRLAINASLQCEPSLIDAADFSPQHRPRLFWGNLPSGVNFPPANPGQDLESVLTPNCNRHALVKKIRTVTTKINSLKQGVSLMKPVLMNGVADSLWITELEVVFGFPKHFTDVKNLSTTKRQKLIGQAWSVQTILSLLLPLRYFFLTKN